MRRDEAEVLSPIRLLTGQEVERGRNDLRSSLSIMASYLTILSALLPYITTSPLSTDIQPHFFIFFFGFYLWTRPARDHINPIVPVAVVLAFTYGGLLLVLHSLTVAIGLVTTVLFVALLPNERRDIVDRCVKLAIILYWVGAGLNILSPESLQFVVPTRTSENRGLTSFTNEPSYLALVALALMIYILWASLGAKWVLAAAALLLLSGSLTGILPGIAVLILYVVHARQVKQLGSVLLVCLALGIIGVSTFDSGSRAYQLAEAIAGGRNVIDADVSVSNRAVRTFGPWDLALSDGFVPHTFKSDELLYVDWANIPDRGDAKIERLSNLASVLVYVLGFVALPFLLIALIYARGPIYIWCASLVFIFANISILTPYVGLVFTFLYQSHASRSRQVGPMRRSGV